MPTAAPSSARQPDRPRPPSPAFSWEQVKAAIETAIADESRMMKSILVGLIENLREESSADMCDALKTLAVEVTDLRATVAELRLALADVRNREPLDLPPAFRSGKTN